MKTNQSEEERECQHILGAIQELQAGLERDRLELAACEREEVLRTSAPEVVAKKMAAVKERLATGERKLRNLCPFLAEQIQAMHKGRMATHLVAIERLEKAMPKREDEVERLKGELEDAEKKLAMVKDQHHQETRGMEYELKTSQDGLDNFRGTPLELEAKLTDPMFPLDRGMIAPHLASWTKGMYPPDKTVGQVFPADVEVFFWRATGAIADVVVLAVRGPSIGPGGQSLESRHGRSDIAGAIHQRPTLWDRDRHVARIKATRQILHEVNWGQDANGPYYVPRGIFAA